MDKSQKKLFIRTVIAFVLFAIAYVSFELCDIASLIVSDSSKIYIEFFAFFIPYLVCGFDVLTDCAKKIGRGNFLDENFLMTVATLGAFALVLFPKEGIHLAEGAAVMIFFRIGEIFENYALDKSRKSVADMLDIVPEYANVLLDGKIVKTDPENIHVGEKIIVLAGEKIPVDGVISEGQSQLETSALTGESVPIHVNEGDEVVSGCINLTGRLEIEVSKEFEDSTVSKILELVENASDRKARTENFITRFAKYYTPDVVGIAVVLAIIPPLFFNQVWSDWIFRGLVFLVVSCPCALVLSVPLTFFGGIGGMSRMGILVKGSNYIEALAKVNTVVMDKTGTLTNGTFEVVAIIPEDGYSALDVLKVAYLVEQNSNHPIAISITSAYLSQENEEASSSNLNSSLNAVFNSGQSGEVCDIKEFGGKGISGFISENKIIAGNAELLLDENIECTGPDLLGTKVFVAFDGTYIGCIVISDTLKEDAKFAVDSLRTAGISKIIMLTGDQEEVAANVASKLGIDDYVFGLYPQEKVSIVESMLVQIHKGKGKLAFVGDGINDAPVLMRSDVGIAMGAMGADVAIEAADIVLMEDKPSCVTRAIISSKRIMRIVWQNIIFALGVKFIVLLLAAIGLASMWLAVFADVGVCVLAILNSMRALKINNA